jgi:hypothetical protein
MAITHLARELRALKAELDAYEAPPTVPTLPPMTALELWQQAMGCEADPWQATVLTSDEPRIVLNVCRQAGKSTVVAIKALHVALYQPDSLILLLSRSLRQSGELARKLFNAYKAVGRVQVSADSETKQTLELANGSRILALPGGDEGAIRGFSGVRLLVMDEAARIPDALWVAVRPMVAVSQGGMLLLSTPFGRRGFFYRVWTASERWLKIALVADQCPRLTPDFLAEERIELGYFYPQEYEGVFLEAIGQVFSDAAIAAAFQDGILPLFGAEPEVDRLVDLNPLFAEP